jgi:hypothetical protein
MRNVKSPIIAALVLCSAFIGFGIIYWHYLDTARPRSDSRMQESRWGPPDIYPDSARAPGAVNPDITQKNIRETICSPDWSTRSVRPSESYTHALKIQQLREYKYADTNLRDYEEDHVIPLELGGDPTDPRNLWPEPYQTPIPDGGALFKDKVENYLHAQVCSGRLSLREAQQEIADDWYKVYAESLRR